MSIHEAGDSFKIDLFETIVLWSLFSKEKSYWTQL